MYVNRLYFVCKVHESRRALAFKINKLSFGKQQPSYYEEEQ